MISRYRGAVKGLAGAALGATLLISTPVFAEGPGYTFVGWNYEWTDVKYAVNPNGSADFNNGTLEGWNVDASLGVLSWFHVYGQYFSAGGNSGGCRGCFTVIAGNRPVNIDLDFSGWKAGGGVNLSLDKIGLNADTDFVLRADYIDVDLETWVRGGVQGSGGWSTEAQVRSQISERAEVWAGYRYTEVDYKSSPSPGVASKGTLKDRSAIVGIAYRTIWNIALTADAVVFDDDTGFGLGFRWYFGDAIFGNRDSIVR